MYHSPLSEELEIRHIGNRAKTHLDLSYSVAVIEVQVSYLDSVNRKGQRRWIYFLLLRKHQKFINWKMEDGVKVGNFLSDSE